MRVSIPTDGQESEEFTENEIYAVNKVCGDILLAWEREDVPCEMIDLVRLLNHGAARAVKQVKDFGLSGGPKGSA